MTDTAKNTLISSFNPYRHKRYCITISQEISLNGQDFALILRYIPDRMLLEHESVAAYLKNSIAPRQDQIETLVHDILEDIMNLIIPRWLEVNLKQISNKAGHRISITIEESQPNWDDNGFLGRLPPPSNPPNSS